MTLTILVCVSFLMDVKVNGIQVLYKVYSSKLIYVGKNIIKSLFKPINKNKMVYKLDINILFTFYAINIITFYLKIFYNI